MMQMANCDVRLPRFWQKLSESDQRGYLALRSELATPKFSNQRGRSAAQFGVMLDLVKSFVVRGDPEDAARALACGMLWMSNGIAVNIQHVKLLTSKCKSSINGSFGQLGYLPVASGADTAGELIQAFPFMKDQFSELRQWTIRTRSGDGGFAPAPIAAKAPDLQLNPFEAGFSLEDEYARLLEDDCPCGALAYVTPPTDIGANPMMDGMELDLRDEAFGIDRGFSLESEDLFSMK
jgi:hypothetical protein